jgi:hypothetical protein
MDSDKTGERLKNIVKLRSADQAKKTEIAIMFDNVYAGGLSDDVGQYAKRKCVKRTVVT